jgi:hypothetical protein
MGLPEIFLLSFSSPMLSQIFGLAYQRRRVMIGHLDALGAATEAEK